MTHREIKNGVDIIVTGGTIDATGKDKNGKCVFSDTHVPLMLYEGKILLI